MSRFALYFEDKSGASAAEYALILAVVGLGIVAAVGRLREAIATAIGTTASRISTCATRAHASALS
jgi:pilus assembly protein Flp/PilA